MAKQAKAETIEVAPQEVATKVAPKKPVENSWEIKDRIYYLKNGKRPLSRSIKSTGIFYFDEEKGYERELKYCQNAGAGTQ